MHRAVEVHSRKRWREEAAVDSVTLAAVDRQRRRIRLATGSATPFLLDLAQVRELADGDGLELDDGRFISVRSAAGPAIEIAVDSPSQLMRIAWRLGNRHLPLQITQGRLRIRADRVIAAMVEGLGGLPIWGHAQFDPQDGAYSGAAYGHID
jgi:urease accessory protein